MGNPGIRVEVANAQAFHISEDAIHEALRTALRLIKKTNVSVEVILVDDSTMREINRTSRGKNESTNVLSFSEPEELPRIPGEPRSLGEIYLAPVTIEQRGENILFLAVHGLLHLLGYTHKSKRDTIEMERTEQEIWQKLLQG